VLQSVAVCCGARWVVCINIAVYCSVLQHVAVCCRALQCVAVCCIVLLCRVERGSWRVFVLQSVKVSHCVAVCCRVLQSVGVCYGPRSVACIRVCRVLQFFEGSVRWKSRMAF